MNSPRSSPEKNREFLFEEGVAHVVEIIQQRLTQKDYVVIIVGGAYAPGSGDTQVGKSAFVAKLTIALEQQHVPAQKIGDFRGLDDQWLYTLFAAQRYQSTRKGVIIVERTIPDLTVDRVAQYRGLMNQFLGNSQFAREQGLREVDAYVLIYTPDKPYRPDQKNLADVIIRNEF